MSTKWLGAAALAAVFVAGDAHAYVTYSDFGYIGENNLTISGPVALTASAGTIQLYENGRWVDSWCVDVYNDLNRSGEFTASRLTNDSGNPPTALTQAQIGEIGALVARGVLLTNNPGAGYTSEQAGAAIQVTIWEIEYPGLTVSGLSSGAQTLAERYYTDATSVWAPNYNFWTLREVNGRGLVDDQSQVTAPEPATWTMMAAGFAALGLAGARKAKARRAAA